MTTLIGVTWWCDAWGPQRGGRTTGSGLAPKRITSLHESAVHFLCCLTEAFPINLPELPTHFPLWILDTISYYINVLLNKSFGELLHTKLTHRLSGEVLKVLHSCEKVEHLKSLYNYSNWLLVAFQNQNNIFFNKQKLTWKMGWREVGYISFLL